jgi:DNA-binding LacI/PurR family transcriptional regulator
MAKVVQMPDLSDAARVLPSRRTGNVYLFTGSGLIKQPEGYSAGVYRAVEAVLRKQGWNPMLRVIRHYPNVPEMVTEEVRSENVDGCIIVCYYKEPLAQALFSSGIPCVAVDFTPDTVPMDCVVTNNRSTATRLMVDLFKLGHMRIDFVGHFHQPPLRDSDAEELEFYWRKALTRGSANGESHYLHGDDRVREYAERLATSDGAPTAVFASNPGMANDILRHVKRLGLSVPGDLSIVTLGGGLNKDMRVSSVDVDWFEMARMTVQRLADLVSGEAQPGARLTYAGEFVDRGTTATARQGSVRRHRSRK